MKETIKALETEVVEVTPRIAAAWLNRNDGRQRMISKRKVQVYAKQIAEGSWRLNGEPIIFSADGVLLDGQHRLHAVIEAQLPMTTVVITGVEQGVMDTIDTGRSRTTADVLTLHDIANSNQVSAAVRQLLIYKRSMSGDKSRWSEADITAHEILQEAQRNEHIREYSKRTYNRKALRRIVNGASAAVCWHLFAKKDPLLADEFFRKLETGEDLSANDPVLVLRNALIANKSAPRHRKLDKNQQMAMLIRTWNRIRQGDAQAHRVNKRDARVPEIS